MGWEVRTVYIISCDHPGCRARIETYSASFMMINAKEEGFTIIPAKMSEYECKPDEIPDDDHTAHYYCAKHKPKEESDERHDA